MHYYTYTETHTDAQLLPSETKAGCLSVLPRGESQWGAAFSSCMCKCHAVPLLHLGKSTEEKLRVQPLWLLWRRCATGYHDEVKKITLNSQTNFIYTKMEHTLCKLQKHACMHTDISNPYFYIKNWSKDYNVEGDACSGKTRRELSSNSAVPLQL